MAAILAERQKQNLIAFRGAVVLYTHRDLAHRKAAEEPIAIGFALARWIAEIFDMTPPNPLADPERPVLDQVTYFPFLTGQENFEGSSEENLNPDVTRRLELLVRALSTPNSQLHAYVAAFGGLPEFKPFLHSLADLHFQGRWLPLQNPEQADKAFVPEQPFITDAGLVQARANALRLLKRWDIHGAAAALAHVPKERAGKWGKVIDRFDTFTAGLGKGDPGHKHFDDALKTFVSNPLNWGKKYVKDGKLYENKKDDVPLRFLLPGLRAESSLRNERWVEALNWTYTFYDTMLVDLIELYCRTLNNFIKIDGKEVRFLGNCLIPSTLIDQTRTDPNWFSIRRKKIIYDDDYVNKNSQNAFNKPEIVPVLSGCGNQWLTAFEAYQQCKNLRNQNTHKVLQPNDVNELEQKMTNAGLWEKQGNGLTVVGTALARGCLTTFRKQNCVSEIEALHSAAVKALIEG